MLGRDAGKIEYWHFKDDSQKSTKEELSYLWECKLMR